MSENIKMEREVSWVNYWANFDVNADDKVGHLVNQQEDVERVEKILSTIPVWFVSNTRVLNICVLSREYSQEMEDSPFTETDAAVTIGKCGPVIVLGTLGDDEDIKIALRRCIWRVHQIRVGELSFGPGIVIWNGKIYPCAEPFGGDKVQPWEYEAYRESVSHLSTDNPLRVETLAMLPGNRK